MRLREFQRDEDTFVVMSAVSQPKLRLSKLFFIFTSEIKINKKTLEIDLTWI
jgi:hypothetical protein